MPRESTFCTIPLGIEISVHRGLITLLSMDIVVEKFLEIGVSDLLVSTHRLQDPLYLEL